MRSDASASVASTSSRGLTIHCRSAGTWRASIRRRWLETGSYADTSSSLAPVSLASSTAASTAFWAVSEPSVPTTIELNTARSYELDDRDRRAHQHADDDRELDPDPERRQVS